MPFKKLSKITNCRLARNRNGVAGKESWLIIPLCGLLVVVSLSFFNLTLYFKKSKQNVLGVSTVNTTAKRSARSPLLSKKIFWQNFLKNNPTYRDGWLELVKIELRLQNPTGAKQAINKASEIDPNSEVIKKVTEELK